jgi:hypothetical protein
MDSEWYFTVVIPRIVFIGDCHIWVGSTQKPSRSGGLRGTVWYEGRKWLAHRAVWTELVGPIPDGYEIDHECGNTLCVHVLHHEPVTRVENQRRY